MGIWKKKKKLEDIKIELSNEEMSAYLEKLISKTKEDLVNMKVQCWIFGREVADPVHLGREEATHRLSEYQKRAKFLEENIKVYQMYQKENGF